MAGLIKQLLHPVAMVWVVFIGLTIWHLYQRQRKLALVNGVVVALMFLIGSTPFANALMGSLEKPYLNQEIDGNVSADVVLVLGGFTGGGDEEPTGIDASGSFDRILFGVDLVRKGKAPNFYLGGGWVDLADGQKVSEHSVIAPWIERWELTEMPVETIGICPNTHGEAMAMKALMDEKGWERVILVTSAWHMPRAAAVFRSTGIEVIPAACDFKSQPPTKFRVIPSAGRMDTFQLYLREKVGWFWYRSRGWIRLEALEEK